MEKLFEVVHEDVDLLVISKPADLVCHPTKGDVYSSLISRVRLYLGSGIQPQLINRLDRETSGLTLVAKNAETARELRIIWEKREVQKKYLAIVHGHLKDAEGHVEAPLGKDERSPCAIKDCVREGGAASSTRYRLVRHLNNEHGSFSLVEVEPLTGRKHQIRIHLAHIGHPIVGDKIYGGDEIIYLSFVEGKLTVEQAKRLILPNQALHAAEVSLTWRGQIWRFQAEPDRRFREFAEL